VLCGGFEKVGYRAESGAEDSNRGCGGGAVAPLELSDGAIEQVEAMAKELRKISGGIWVLVAGIGKLMEVVEGMGKEVAKADKEMETEEIQKMDRQTEMEKKEDDSEEEEESEKEEEKEEKGDNGKEKVIERRTEKKGKKSK
jgi:Sec-independent protein translocase protein TatA